mmetsp:Transcript_2621/g.3770  ORF Transcript_2621/g.3770 Transcript_2621/m.3770 type:complete len:479 (-) Transcript_2621:64-1500(-)
MVYVKQNNVKVVAVTLDDRKINRSPRNPEGDLQQHQHYHRHQEPNINNFMIPEREAVRTPVRNLNDMRRERKQNQLRSSAEKNNLRQQEIDNISKHNKQSSSLNRDVLRQNLINNWKERHFMQPTKSSVQKTVNASSYKLSNSKSKQSSKRRKSTVRRRNTTVKEPQSYRNKYNRRASSTRRSRELDDIPSPPTPPRLSLSKRRHAQQQQQKKQKKHVRMNNFVEEYDPIMQPDFSPFPHSYTPQKREKLQRTPERQRKAPEEPPHSDHYSSNDEYNHREYYPHEKIVDFGSPDTLKNEQTKTEHANVTVSLHTKSPRRARRPPPPVAAEKPERPAASLKKKKPASTKKSPSHHYNPLESREIDRARERLADERQHLLDVIENDAVDDSWTETAENLLNEAQTSGHYHSLTSKLKRLLDMSKELDERDRMLNICEVGLLLERNVYIDKLKNIEAFGNRHNWEGYPLQQIQQLLFENRN